MRKKILYTIGRPQAELEAMRQLIARERDIDTQGLHLYDLSAKLDYGRVHYAVCDEKTGKGLIFTIHHNPRHNPGCPELSASEWEIKRLKKLAWLLGIDNFTMLPPLRLFEEEIHGLQTSPSP